MDQVSDKRNSDEAWAENLTITEIMKKLNDREKMIISKRFFNRKNTNGSCRRNRYITSTSIKIGKKCNRPYKENV